MARLASERGAATQMPGLCAHVVRTARHYAPCLHFTFSIDLAWQRCDHTYLFLLVSEENNFRRQRQVQMRGEILS